MAGRILNTLRKRTRRVLILVSILMMSFSVFSLVIRRDASSIFMTISSSIFFALIIIFFRYQGKLFSKIPKKIDEKLVLSILHMYVVSQGEVGPDHLVSSVAKMKEYGYYSKVFSKIREIAKDFGYGFAKAMWHMANLVKAPLKDILIRCTEALSSPEPKEYLELESSSLFEEYSGYYLRAIEAIKTLGGVYGTFQSVSVFIIMTVNILTVFINESNLVLYSYLISSVLMIILYLGFRTVIPKETLVYIDKEDPPRLYKLFRLSAIIAFLSIFPAVFIGIRFSYSFGFIVFGTFLLIPGFIAYVFESRINKIDEYYPTLIKALCENMASTSSIKSALSYVLRMELGPLKTLLGRTFARIKLGIRTKKALRLLSSESASFRVYTTNQMLLDSMNYSADLMEVGKILGNACIKFLEFRKRKSSVAKSFKTIIFILQPVTVALLVVLTYLCLFFSQNLVSLPYFSFGKIDIFTVQTGNIIVILLTTTLNALALKDAEGGFWGTSLLYAGLLLIVSGSSWFAGEKLMDMIFGQMFKGFDFLTNP
ncbi:MAG: hypothetical protein ACTSYM_02280 [Candidatus Baldrarchaeia archaeon]